jgi:hypothetical protein
MATPNQWAISESGDVSFFDLVTNKAIVTLSTLKSTSIDTTGETQYSRGGRGNAKIVGFSSNREAKLVMQDAIFDNKAVAMLTGNDLVSGVKTVDLNEVQSVTSNTITLAKTPKGALISVFKVNADGTNGQEYTLGTPGTNALEYSINAKVLTFHTSVANSTKIRVYYKADTASDAKTIKVTADSFGKSFRVSIDVLVTDIFTKKSFNGQINIPNAKFEDNFSLQFTSEGEPAVLDLNMEILKAPTSTDMYELIVFDKEQII